MNMHMAKKWPEKVVQRSFIKGHSFPIGLYFVIPINKARLFINQFNTISGQFLKKSDFMIIPVIKAVRYIKVIFSKLRLQNSLGLGYPCTMRT